MKIASLGLVLLLCVFVVDAIVDFVPNDPPSPVEKKDASKTKKDTEEVIENDDKETHPDGDKAKEKTDTEGLLPLKKLKSNDGTKKGDKVENDSDDNPDKVSASEARMDHAENMDKENPYGEKDPEMGKDYGEEEDNSYDSVHGYLKTDENPIEDEANSITDIDLNHDDANINHDDVGTG